MLRHTKSRLLLLLPILTAAGASLVLAASLLATFALANGMEWSLSVSVVFAVAAVIFPLLTGLLVKQELRAPLSLEDKGAILIWAADYPEVLDALQKTIAARRQLTTRDFYLMQKLAERAYWSAVAADWRLRRAS